MNCLVYLPHSYNGGGPAGSCVQIVRHFEAVGFDTRLFVGRERKRIPATVRVWRALPRLFNAVPWRFAARFAQARLDRAFRHHLLHDEPGIAYFWPTPDPELVDLARSKGWITVREMTNRTLDAAKTSLDRAFALAAEPRPHHISAAQVAAENALLAKFDYIFSSNDDVDASLEAVGVERARILQTSFGWAEERFGRSSPPAPNAERLEVGYLGTISIGKGVLDLLEAWRNWQGQGRLRLAGPIDWSMADAVRTACEADPRIERVGYVEDVETFFQSCDVVVIPTLDEGGPQVTYEAAAAGATIVATPLARARMLEDGANCLLVPVHDGAAITRCFDRLLADPPLRRRLGDQARSDAARFAYQRVGQERARMLKDILHGDRGATVRS